MPDRKKKSEKAAAGGQDSTTEDAPAKDSNNNDTNNNNNNANAGSEKEKENEPKTIDTIWKQAVEKIAKENNINVDKLQQAGTFQDADSGIAKATKLFENSRHPKDKKDKAMTAVGGCLDWIDSTAGFVKDNVSGTYAIPAQILAGSISYMIQAAKNVSEDLDLISKTFETIHIALQDIGDLKGRQFAASNFLNRLMDIFIALLDFTTFSGKMFKEYSRKRLFLRALVKGQNDKIHEKCDQVEKVILLFRATVPFQILEAVGRMDERLENLPNSFIQALQDRRFKTSDLQDLQALLSKGSPLTKVTDILKKKYGLDPESISQMDTQRELIKKRFVQGTFSWLKDYPSYKVWLKGQNTPFLYISGAAGTGKTFFTFYCNQLIEETTKQSRSVVDSSKPRPTTLVTSFSFEPGKQDSQSFQSVLASLIVQIADRDTKLCEAIAKDVMKGNENINDDDKSKFLWDNLLLKKFEKNSDTSRILYILLDGVDQMEEDDRHSMLRIFQTLNSDKSGIRILMTGTPETYDKVSSMLKSAKINLAEKEKAEGDFKVIIDDRIKNSDSLKAFSADAIREVKMRLLSSTSVLSSVDLTLSMMEQCDGDEKAALEKISKVDSRKGLYDAMIEILKSKRSELERKGLETLFTLCTYAKEALSVYQLQQIARLDPSFGDLDIGTEIQNKSSSLLYTVNKNSSSNSTDSLPSEDTIPEENPSPENAKLSESKDEFVFFRQPAFRDYLEQSQNEMIQSPMESKINLFVRLCGILCDRDPVHAQIGEALQEYAATYLIQHLKDIDIKNTTPEQGSTVVEALSRVMTNENNVSLVFESVMMLNMMTDVEFDLYDLFSRPRPFSWETAGVLLAWAKKMSFHEEQEMSDRAKTWVENTIRDTEKNLETLAGGHVESWAGMLTVEDADIPYKLAYRALCSSGQLSDTSSDEITPSIAKEMLRFGQEHCLTTPAKLARGRIAAALLLNNSDNAESRKAGAELYETNIKEISTPGPERFYSFLGLAEYHANVKAGGELSENVKVNWEKVVEYANKALKERDAEKGALGSELNNERSAAAYLLKANALNELNDDTDALETCEKALEPGELEYSNKLLQFLTIVIRIYAKNKQHANIVKEMQQQSPRIRSEWLFHPPYILNDKRDAFREAAVLTRRVDFVIQVYEDAIEYWQAKDTFRSLMLQLELGNIYRRDARATKMAERTLNNIMDTVKEDPTQLSGTLPFVMTEMVDILHENFTTARRKLAREKIINQLCELLKDLKQTEIIESIVMGRACLTLAQMWKEYGDMRAAKREAEYAFNSCIADLEDTVGWNDHSALRLLGKVLMFVDLEDDAMIALSLQFSNLNPTYDDSSAQQNNETAQDETGVSGVPEKVTGEHVSEPESDQRVEDLKTNGELPQNQTSEQPVSANGVDVPSSSDSPKVSLDQPSTNGKTESGETSSDSSKGSPETAATTVSSQQDVSTSTTTTEPPATDDLSDEDLLGDGDAFLCNGPCNIYSVDKWEHGTVFYNCVDCNDVDFCSDCYQTQLKFYTDMGEGFWFKCCWGKHRFIQQPIDDWKGVKNGMIRIGGKQKHWHDWLESVKGRWKRRLSQMN